MESAIEPILDPSIKRYVMYPIQHTDLWNMYQKALSSFWNVGEIDVSGDIIEWETKLSQNERNFMSQILAFFAASDGLVNENLVESFSTEVQILEAKCFYGIQIAMENIHSEMYSLLIVTLIKSEKEKARLFNAIETIPTIREKAEWTLKWMNKFEIPFVERLVAFACVEGIFFSGAFAAIFWLQHRHMMTNAIGKSNEYISRDEALHRDFACLLFRKYIHYKPSRERVLEIVTEAVIIEQKFMRESLPVNMIGMNADLMCQYIEYVADHLIASLGFETYYKVANPFGFIVMLGLEGKTNFFEKRVSEYHVAGSKDVFNMNADF